MDEIKPIGAVIKLDALEYERLMRLALQAALVDIKARADIAKAETARNVYIHELAQKYGFDAMKITQWQSNDETHEVSFS